MDNFKVTLGLVVTNADGSPFFNSNVCYAAMPYAAMVSIERRMVTLLSDLVAQGEAQAAATPPDA